MPSSCGRDEWVETSEDYGGILVLGTVALLDENLGFVYRSSFEKDLQVLKQLLLLHCNLGQTYWAAEGIKLVEKQ